MFNLRLKNFFSKKILILFIVLFFIVGHFFTNLDSANVPFLSNEQKQFIQKYFFPYQIISQQEQVINENTSLINGRYLEIMDLKDIVSHLSVRLELETKESGSDIEVIQTNINLSNDLTLEKFQLLSGFYSGINLEYPGSGYIDFHKDNTIIMSSRGLLVFKKDFIDDKASFKQISTNINNFIGLDQYDKNKWFSIKDILIFNNQIYVAFTEEIRNDCWNTSVVSADMDYKKIKFKELFSSQDCVHSINNIDGQFNAHQSGGRIIQFDDNHILLSIGDYRSRHLAQDKKSVNGKIIKINILNRSYKIISMGHRNPQGLYFDKNKNIILETEHGPEGGDEINIIEVSKFNQDEVQNYGWAISSAGEHYGGRVEKNLQIYEKYPLHNSHSDFGFIEPVKSFVPSIGISEIVKIGQNKYVVSSLKDKALYFFELDKNSFLINLNRVEVSERIRDMQFKNNQIYLFMEDTASIGIINLG